MLTKLQSFSREVVPVHLSGNVSIDPTAAIAPGVLLQADPDSILTIGAGVCIGTGSIVHAAKGSLAIGAGVCLGRGVMIIGTGSIEQNACIGSGTTILDPQIEAGEAIPPNSIVGDRSRGEVSVVKTEDLPISPPPTPVVAPPVEPDPTLEQLWDTSDAWDTPPTQAPPVEAPSKSQESISQAGGYVKEDPIPQDEGYTNETRVTVEVKIEQPSVKTVAGQANFDRLKRKLFPHIAPND
jgi:carbon dioxide concentrating mechanism protein CcmN